jgi:hypothetical protein
MSSMHTRYTKHTQTQTSKPQPKHKCTHTHTHTHIYSHTHTHTCTGIHNTRVRTNTNTHIRANKHTPEKVLKFQLARTLRDKVVFLQDSRDHLLDGWEVVRQLSSLHGVEGLQVSLQQLEHTSGAEHCAECLVLAVEAETN